MSPSSMGNIRRDPAIRPFISDESLKVTLKGNSFMKGTDVTQVKEFIFGPFFEFLSN
jgi:hypothetical protein